MCVFNAFLFLFPTALFACSRGLVKWNIEVLLINMVVSLSVCVRIVSTDRKTFFFFENNKKSTTIKRTIRLSGGFKANHIISTYWEFIVHWQSSNVFNKKNNRIEKSITKWNCILTFCGFFFHLWSLVVYFERRLIRRC